MIAELLHLARNRAFYRAGTVTVSFTGMERISNRFPADYVPSQFDSFLITRSTNNQKGVSASAFELSWSSAHGVVLRLFY
nr:hypothetical protein [Rhizobium sp. ACO-34A]